MLLPAEGRVPLSPLPVIFPHPQKLAWHVVYVAEALHAAAAKCRCFKAPLLVMSTHRFRPGLSRTVLMHWVLPPVGYRCPPAFL